MGKDDMDMRLTEIELAWAERREVYADDIRANAFCRLPAGEITAEREFLAKQARKAIGAVKDERLSAVEAELRDYRDYNQADIRGNKEVRYAIGKLAREAELLIGLIHQHAATPA